MMRLFPLLLLSALILVACQPAMPPRPAPLIDVPESYSMMSENFGRTLSPDWWREFNDPLLDRLMERLTIDNLSVRQAFLRLDQLEARYRGAEAGLWPTLNLTGSLRREQTVGPAGESRSSAGRLAVAAAYEIDLWQRLRHRATAADLRMQAGEADIRTLIVSLRARLAELYFIAVEQRAQLELLERRLSHQQQLVDIIDNRYRSGLAGAAELYQSRQNLAQMQAQIPLYRSTLIQTENAMALLLGQAPGNIVVERRELAVPATVMETGLPAQLLERRPDVSAALLELQAADADLAAALADRLPRLDLTANIGRSVTRLSSGDVNGTVWSLALGLAQPLFDGGRLKAASDLQAAIRDEKLLAAQLKLLTAIEEVESALHAESYSAERAQLLERQQQMNAKTLAIRTNDYHLGLTDSLELLRSEMAQLDIRSQQLSNQRQWLSHRISLIRALGGRGLADISRREFPATGSGELPTLPLMTGYACPDGSAFLVDSDAETARIHFEEAILSLPRTVSASGEKYEQGATLYWNRGDVALFEMAGRGYFDCERMAASVPRQAARQRGVIVRAVGQEPGWLVEISATEALIITDYGQHRHQVAAPPGTTQTKDNQLLYLLSESPQPKTLLLTRKVCRDSMSGEIFPARAVLTIEEKSYAGCADLTPDLFDGVSESP